MKWDECYGSLHGQTKNLSHLLVHVSPLSSFVWHCLIQSSSLLFWPRSSAFHLTKIAGVLTTVSVRDIMKAWICNQDGQILSGRKMMKKHKQARWKEIGSCWRGSGPVHPSIKASSRSQNISSYTNYLAPPSFNWVYWALDTITTTWHCSAVLYNQVVPVGEIAKKRRRNNKSQVQRTTFTWMRWWWEHPPYATCTSSTLLVGFIKKILPRHSSEISALFIARGTTTLGLALTQIVARREWASKQIRLIKLIQEIYIEKEQAAERWRCTVSKYLWE